MNKILSSISATSYLCLAMGVCSTIFVVLWLGLGGRDAGLFQTATLVMYLSIVGALMCTLISMGATSLQFCAHCARSLLLRRRAN